MDPRSSAQDLHRCGLCEIAIVHTYCDFCHVNLCKPCIGDHISDGYDKHKIVSSGNEDRPSFIQNVEHIQTKLVICSVKIAILVFVLLV